MGKEDLSKYVILGLVLAVVTNQGLVHSQNLSKYYGRSCDFYAAQRDQDEHIKQCNGDLKKTSEEFVYVVLVCTGRICECPDKFALRGKQLNATGYEWTEERAQCLLSVGSDCSGLAKGLCASGKCADGRCFNVTGTRMSEEDNNGRRLLGTAVLINLSIFLPIIVSQFNL